MRTETSTRLFIVIAAITTLLVLICIVMSTAYSQGMTGPLRKVDARTRAAVIDSVAAALNDEYIFADVAAAMEKSLRKNLQSGAYDTIADLMEFTERLTTDLQSVSHDKHLRIGPLPPRDPSQQPPPSPERERERELQRLREDNFGFKKVELLPGNIGYLDFRYFADATREEAGRTAIAAMNFLAHADALIFDMRQNGGGNPSMIQLITSYLFEEPVHLNSFYIRKTNETNQFWTQAHVEGPKMVNIPVFVLTSDFTFSGAEEFTYNLKNLKRGTIIGETTGGGAHPVSGRSFENLGVQMTVPFGRAVNPITKTNWEGTGVEPDISVPAEQALLTARIEAAKELQKRAHSEDRRKAVDWMLKGLEVEMNPVSLDSAAMREYVGDFGPRKIFLEHGDLYYQRESRPKYKLIPMGNNMFMLAGLDNFRIQFNRGEGGMVTELVGLYGNGSTDINRKSLR